MAKHKLTSKTTAVILSVAMAQGLTPVTAMAETPSADQDVNLSEVAQPSNSETSDQTTVNPPSADTSKIMPPPRKHKH